MLLLKEEEKSELDTPLACVMRSIQTEVNLTEFDGSLSTLKSAD